MPLRLVPRHRATSLQPPSLRPHVAAAQECDDAFDVPSRADRARLRRYAAIARPHAEHGALIEALVISTEQAASTAIATRYYESPTTMGAQLHVLDDCARGNVRAAATRDVRVVVYTGGSSLADNARAECAAVLRKPARPEEIPATVQRAASVTGAEMQ